MLIDWSHIKSFFYPTGAQKMALDWSEVKKKYGKGFMVPTVAGGKFLMKQSTLNRLYGKSSYTEPISKKAWS